MIYAIGGGDDAVTLNTVEAFDPSTQVWATRSPMSTARSGLAAASSAGVIYAIGGIDQSDSVLSNVEQYTPSTNSWAIAASMPTPRVSPSAVTGPHGKIYAIGGWYIVGGTLTIVAAVEAFTP